MGAPIDRRRFLQRLATTTVALGAAGCGAEAGRPHHRTFPHRRLIDRHTPPIPARLSEAIRGPVLTRRSRAFGSAAHVFNARFDAVVPAAVAFPRDADDVSAAVRWAVAHGVALRARSGGHSYAGYSTVNDGLVLDLRNLDTIRVDRGQATIGAGAQLIDVYRALAKRGVTIPAGSCPSVGVAGHALGGGMGLAGRAFGLTADNIAAVELVTADGQIRQVDGNRDPELLWALRGGGGGNFGVVTGLRLRVHPIPAAASGFFVSWPWSAANEALAAWERWAPHAPDELTSILHLEAGGENDIRVTGQYLGSASVVARLLSPLTDVAGASLSVGGHDYFGLQVRWAGCLGQSPASCHTVGTRPGGTLARESFNAKSDYVDQSLPAAGRAAIIDAIERRLNEPGSGAILLDSYGGAINRLAGNATAFVHRNSLYCVQYLTYGGGDRWLDQAHTAMRPFVSGMAYQNYIDPGLANWRLAYYGANYRRLVDVQRRVDPDHFFRFPQAVGA